ncbi:ankyrin repeat-containing domain protein [Baffinella frigidus]|nr:ankyrin repeat-containing domain protein [Cryptophyta sp. CCMP2293]
MLVRKAIRDGADVSSPDPKFHSWTALHFAADKGHNEVVRVLVAMGAVVDAQDQLLAHSPLHLAANQGRLDVVKRLLDAGADPTLRNKHGVTPTQVAVAVEWRSTQHHSASLDLQAARDRRTYEALRSTV